MCCYCNDYCSLATITAVAMSYTTCITLIKIPSYYNIMFTFQIEYYNNIYFLRFALNYKLRDEKWFKTRFDNGLYIYIYI